MPGYTPLPAIALNLPLLPLRDVVVFPHMVIPLFVGRPKSIKALEKAMEADRRIMLVAQKAAAKDEPSVSDMFDVGCVSTILQMLKLPDGTVKVLVEGQQRAQVAAIEDAQTHFTATVTPVEASKPGETETRMPSREIEALRRAVMQQFDQYVKINKKIPPEILTSIASIDDPGRLADTIAAHLPLKLENKQLVLDLADVKARLEYLFEQLDREVDILNVDRKIRGRVKRQMEKNQRDFYLNEQVKAIQKELGEGEEGADIDEIEKKIKLAKMPAEARKKADGELKKLKLMSPMSAEATVVRNYIDVLSNLPWSKKTKIKYDLVNAEEVLNADHFGLDKVKDRILEYLAVQQRVDKVKAPILCLVGPPGVGKTSLGQSIARATGRKYVRMALGGMRDEAEIRGHRRTYIGALPGKVLQSLSKVGTRNPLFLLDEIDKLGTDFRGDPASALLEVLDPEQNHTFGDHYVEVDFDLSDVMFVATSNSMSIPPALLDRMEVIRLSGYTEDEKISIAMKYLLPKQLKNNGVKDEELLVTEAAVRDMVRYYTREAGVRSLERELSKICRKLVKGLQLKKLEPQVVLTADNLPDYLGVHKYTYGRAELQNQVGQVVGLAWTEVGGDLLTIEVATMPGKGVITRTGSLGDVMKESVEAARTVVRSRSRMLGIKDETFEKRDIHIHVPDGATPKDGPSAGAAMTTAFVSALTGIPVRGDVAMTGEITLRGEVTAIGGLKEKLLAALRGGIKTVLIPQENVKDLQEIPDNVKNGLEIVPVRWIDKVLEVALERKPVPLTDEEVTVMVAAAAADKTVAAAVLTDGLKH
ncbi:endopeptidase La [Verminephrobacter eiseniae]|uniref:Lon protease n=1 Tax=Verminephrobacter eiseniae (strain EF01-2) TaxID=391735 RepID=A1WR19_VEREI|nr:endopeptidase La [Verminephrobacter eiseniae]KAB7565974.1 endopeptidase La [Verminephrobacter sp. Larva24]ABM60076.1 Lon-A peptidase. Serine peptidase. MEROPS family S16 [Verminephrobacter eiseniae EF01-2]MCW5230503.1 endopeptidase La [Verminephrobacter eiseniae]MCW5260315.1 endopeptidase La [Verminephrobacter eiseniae]MCW5285571.1 endopeptidase La [Verminephrobacter eiseniae]